MAAILKKFASALPHDDDIIYIINRFYTTFRNYENEIKILRFLKKTIFFGIKIIVTLINTFLMGRVKFQREQRWCAHLGQKKKKFFTRVFFLHVFSF